MIKHKRKKYYNSWCYDNNYKLKENNHNSWFKSEYSQTKDIIITKTPSTSTVMRCKRIYVYPTADQKKILDTWFNIYCIAYNATVKYIKTHKNVKINFQVLRPIIKGTFNGKQMGHIKSSKIPIHTVDHAINDVIKAYKSNFAKGGSFRIRYKKQSSSRKTLTFDAQCFSKNKNTFCPRVFNVFTTSESIKGIKKESRLTCDSRRGVYILNVPYEKPMTKIEGREKMIALDPGIRDFQTGYSDVGIYHYGRNITKKIKKHLNQIDNIRSKQSNRRMKKAEYKRIDKIQNLVNDLHYKTIDDICSNYDIVKIGKISIQSIMSNNNGLHSMVKRIGYALSHYKYRQRLKDRCEEMNVKYIEIDEQYTSKTCSRCGNMKHNLGSNKEYKCNTCSLTIDRDVNASINIYNRD
jgi:transposase